MKNLPKNTVNSRVPIHDMGEALSEFYDELDAVEKTRLVQFKQENDLRVAASKVAKIVVGTERMVLRMVGKTTKLFRALT